MGLQVAVAAPFKQRGTDRIPQSEFVVALSLDRDWFSPDQAKRLVDVAVGQDLLDRDDDDLVARFAREDVVIPDGFVPDESLLQEQSAFEMALDAAVAEGTEKQAAVASINETQSNLGVSVEAAAVVYARGNGLDAEGVAARARAELDAPDLAGDEPPDGDADPEPTADADESGDHSEDAEPDEATDSDGRIDSDEHGDPEEGGDSDGISDPGERGVAGDASDRERDA